MTELIVPLSHNYNNVFLSSTGEKLIWAWMRQGCWRLSRNLLKTKKILDCQAAPCLFGDSRTILAHTLFFLQSVNWENDLNGSGRKWEGVSDMPAEVIKQTMMSWEVASSQHSVSFSSEWPFFFPMKTQSSAPCSFMICDCQQIPPHKWSFLYTPCSLWVTSTSPSVWDMLFPSC